MTTASTEMWRSDDGHDVDKLMASLIQQEGGTDVHQPEFLNAIESSIDSLSDKLRTLSLDIHGESLRCMNRYN